jgi:hypothetical protein
VTFDTLIEKIFLSSLIIAATYNIGKLMCFKVQNGILDIGPRPTLLCFAVLVGCPMSDDDYSSHHNTT